eukprot:1518374-Prymnesium_polylepis.1
MGSDSGGSGQQWLIGRSAASRSIGRSVDRGWSRGASVGVGASVGRPIGRSVGWLSVGRSVNGSTLYIGLQWVGLCRWVRSVGRSVAILTVASEF